MQKHQTAPISGCHGSTLRARRRKGQRSKASIAKRQRIPDLIGDASVSSVRARLGIDTHRL